MTKAEKLAERWSDIIGYESLYQVSTYGRIRSLPKVVKRFGKYGVTAILSERILKQSLANGYLKVGLTKNKKLKTKTVHRLVAICFLKNPKNKREVNHIDGNKTNNHVSNLEWATRLENHLHALDLGLIKSGEQSRLSKLSKRSVYIIRSLLQQSYKKIGTRFGVDSETITKIAKGNTWKRLV